MPYRQARCVVVLTPARTAPVESASRSGRTTLPRDDNADSQVMFYRIFREPGRTVPSFARLPGIASYLNNERSGAFEEASDNRNGLSGGLILKRTETITTRLLCGFRNALISG